jgi:hypothetical protein
MASGRALLLGMVHALPPKNTQKAETYGQECRDRIRCDALTSEYEVIPPIQYIVIHATLT